ncbi:MAG TPA: hypothetical protein VI548_10380 [Chitinophagaceae bacterium]|nr:hypothetical protein [Chitinophagaceae bacterium]
MKRHLPITYILLFLFSTLSSAQNLTGIWRGYFVTNSMEQYRYEVQIEHNSKNRLSGVTYSYLDKRFYGKTTMTGSFKTITGDALIQEIKTIEVRMSLGSVACIQKCLLSYTKSGREEFLEGTFTSVFEKTDSTSGYIRGEDCGGGRMYLRKVTTSDFYIEPFLRNKTGPQTVTPPLVKNNPPASKPPVTKTPVNQSTNRNTVVSKPKTDSVNKIKEPVAKSETPKDIYVKPKMNVPEILKQRQNDLVRTLNISSENITIKIYDNGEIDDDTISVYLDNQLILSKKRLTASAITINLKMDESNDEHELVMVAENLGRIPPNTSLMIVTAGDKRYEVRITSTEQKNAVVRFKYIKPDKP